MKNSKRGTASDHPLMSKGQKGPWELHSSVIGFEGLKTWALICGNCGVETDSGRYWLSDWASLV